MFCSSMVEVVIRLVFKLDQIYEFILGIGILWSKLKRDLRVQNCCQRINLQKIIT